MVTINVLAKPNLLMLKKQNKNWQTLVNVLSARSILVKTTAKDTLNFCVRSILDSKIICFLS